MLTLTNVTKSFETTTALHSVSLDIAPEKTTVLIGPSGCGKSTLLRLVIGLLDPDDGSIEFEGMEVQQNTILKIRHRIGYVIQDGGLFPHLTARQNITLMARYLNRESGWITSRLKNLTELTQFPNDGLERFPSQLSGGQRQRVSLMRALMLEPDLLLMDEPLGALDPMIRAGLQTDLKQIFSTLKKTVLMVTHDMGEAGYFGDNIVLMRAGEIVQQGSLKSLVHDPADRFVTDFINAQRSPLEDFHP